MIELLAPEHDGVVQDQAQAEVPAKRGAPKGKRHRTVSEIIFEKQSSRRMSLPEQIDLASKWLRSARSSKEALRWSNHLAQLRAMLPARRPKSKPGVNMQRIQRAERAEELNAAKRRLKDAGQYDRPTEGSGSI